ncbi:replicative DNA helicase DnaB [Deferribacter desulfuricans SSM1]|uniref:Replicative DNA helicase n=1 Tax=Deferribacter desulfuricans (strain DSM 14783 / JCM 11476 / NBRC 101012 / SSM1) TaxID=639282 RepID=D3PAC3_DEFDS|nr:replicative DNA helicase [Deferribacter desulfuricans]BAI79546.1 replicative DNA helicase DnaB [Deferribacter desulfuricans SSM1]
MQKTNFRTPPHNLEAEQGVLASILIDEKALDKVIHLLNADDFYHPAHKLIFSTLIKLAQENKPLDIVTLISKLTDENKIEEAGGIDYISSLTDIIPNAANVGYYATIVKDKALLRNLIEISGKISSKAYEFSGDITELLDETEKEIFKLAEYKLKGDIRPLSELISESFELLQNLYEKKEDIIGIPSGYTDLDKLTNGFQDSDLIIVAGRPGMGKTAFALNIALNASYRFDKSIAIFSLEMSANQLVQRLLATEAKIESSKLRSGKLNMEEWNRLASVGGELNDLKLFIDDTPAISVMELRAKCRRLKKEHGLDMVIVDYLQLMSGSNVDSREQQISEISRSLKALAKELNIPVIALSQLNRSVENRSDKRPQPSDLRESGAIEQDADLIIFLYRDEVYHKDSKFQGLCEVIVAKHRNGPTGSVYLAFLKEFTRFENAELRTV